MWLVIFAVTILGALGALIFLFTRFQKFFIVRKIAGDRRVVRWLLALIPILLIIVFCFIDTINTIIVVLNLMLVWILADFLVWIVRKIERIGKGGDAGKIGNVGNVEKNIKEESAEIIESGIDGEGKKTEKNDKNDKGDTGIYYTGIAVIVFNVIYLLVGAFLAYHVVRTSYDLKTEKKLSKDNLKLVLIADSHIGTTFDGEGFAKHMKTIQDENPDAVLIAGDFVDDDTNKEDMIRSCQALGELETTCGIYYVCGNHDKGYSNYRGFSYENLTAELRKNGVVVLEDEAVLVMDSFYIIGRKDKGDGKRKSPVELLEGLDKSKYMIMLDHQPSDYRLESASEVDLVLSGHTHGGQMIPITKVGEWIGANDGTYGYERINNTDFIITSGISDWAIKFKTGTKSEYVVLNILSQ